MTNAAFAHRAMIAAVARALGPDLLARMAFLGGCATGLLITDEVTRESVRYTDDVDLIFNGRDDIVRQIAAAAGEVRCYIADAIAGLLKTSDFEYAIQGNLHDPDRETVIFERLEAVAVTTS